MSGNFIRSLLIALCITQVVYGQFDKLVNYNVKDGLSSSEIYGVMQDSKGFIWANGDMGVSRFNGYEFKNFSTENGLPDNTVFGIYEDKKNRLWFRSMSGRLSYYKNDKIYTIPCNDTLEKLMKGNFINSMVVDKGDTIWLGVTNNFFIKINPGWHTGDLKKIEMPGGKYFFNVDNYGLIYGGNDIENYTITQYTKQAKQVFTFDPKIENKEKNYLRFYLIQLKDRTYLASLNKKLIQLNSKGIIRQEQVDAIAINLHEDQNNSFIVSTYNGISFYSSNNLKKIRSITQLKNKIVTSVCVDKENGLWLATEGQGLFYIPHRNFLYYTSQNGVPETKITCLGLCDTNLAIGHLDGSASVLYRDTVHKILNQYKTNDYAQSKRLTSISNYGNKTLVTSMRGLYYLNNIVLKIIPEFKSSLKRCIKSKDGNIWILNYSQIIKYDENRSFKKIDSLLLKARTDNIFEDSEGSLWLSALNGVYIYKNKELTYLGLKDELFSIRASDICEASDKSIWIATRGGGVMVKKRNKTIQIIEKHGLAGNMCRCLFVDSNAVWVGTNKGLSRILILGDDTYSIDNFYAKNGLLTNEVNMILKHNNKLWLTHNNGVSVFDVAKIKPNKYPPPVYILQTFVNDSLCKKEDLMKLPYDRNYLTINYIGLSYKDAGNIEYKYKMDGIDSNWIYTNYTSVNYRTLPPGTYRFLVSAKNNDGYWSYHPATLSVTILPAWWQTWVFILFVFIVIIVLMILIFKYRLNLIKNKERLKAIQQTKLTNAELKALRSQMNPHFVFNAINSVQYFITNNDPASSQKYLSKFAKLIRYVVDNSKPSVIPLSKELDALNLYLDLESLRFENKFEYIVEVNKNIDIDNVKIPSMLIQPYVENAIWHGLMHKETKGKIKIEIDVKENVMLCVIEDNGIGRKRAREIIIEKGNEFHKSVGMSITQERLDVINQQNKSNLTVTIIDLKDELGVATGTRVELNLPFY